MMKAVLAISFFSTFLLSLTSSAQNIKKFELEQCGDSELYIAKSKKGNGLYNKKNESWAILPSASTFLYQEGFDMLYQIQKDSVLIGYSVNENTSSYRRFKSDNNSRLLFSSEGYHNFNGLVLSQDKVFYRKNLDKEPVLAPADDFFDENMEFAKICKWCDYVFGIEVRENQILSYEIRSESDLDKAIPSIQYPGEDSVGSDNAIVYYPPFPPVSLCGVYSDDKKIWTVPRNYSSLKIIGDYLIAGNVLENEKDVEIDWYKKDEEYSMFKEGIKFIKDLPLATIFGSENYSAINADSSYFKVFQKDSIFLIEQSLMSARVMEGDLYMGIPSNSILDQKFSAKASDLLFLEGYPEVLFTFLNNKAQVNIENHDSESYEIQLKSFERVLRNLIFVDPANKYGKLSYFEIDGQFYFDSLKSNRLEDMVAVQKLPITEIQDGYDYKFVENNLVVNTLIPEKNWRVDYLDGYEANTDKDGNIYYLDFGKSNAGVYDVLKKAWIISPDKISIHQKEEGYLVLHRTDDTYSNSTVSYTMFDFDGQKISEPIGNRSILYDGEKLAWLVNAPKLDTAYPLSSWNISHAFYKLENKTGLANLKKNQIEIEPKDYLYAFNTGWGLWSLHVEQQHIELNILKTHFDFEIDENFHFEIGRSKNEVLSHKIYLKSGKTEYYIENRSWWYNLADTIALTNAKAKIFSQLKNGDDHYLLKGLNDSLLYVEDFILDDIDSLKLGRSLSDEDLYKTDEELGVYFKITKHPGHFRSGIYNYKKDNWLVNPKYHWIEIYEDGYLCRKPIISEGELMTSSFLYDYYYKSGEEVWVNRSLNQLNDSQKSFVQKQRKITE